MQKEFPGISGFSERNLWLITQFYNEYHEVEFLQPLVAVVEYSLKTSSMPIGVSTYITTSRLPKDYKHLLPDSKAIDQKIDRFFQGDVEINRKNTP